MHFPTYAISALNTLGSAIGGSALVLTGLVISHPFRMNPAVLSTTAAKLIVQPILALCITLLLHMSHDQVRNITLISAIPGGFFGLAFGKSFNATPEIRHIWFRCRHVAVMDSDPEPIRVSRMSMRSPIPYAHDLLLVKSTTIEEACMAEPTWVRPALARYSWVVARRAISPEDRIAVGVRGQERQQRWGGFIRKDQIVKVISPWHLRSGLANTVSLSLPALQALRFLEIELASLSNDWGPGGSVGYELASRAPVVTRKSDLDLVIKAQDRFDRDFAQHLWKKIALAPAKVDSGRSTMLVSKTAAAKTRARFREPRPDNAPIAAEHQIVAAVFSPLTFAPSLKMTSAPRNPTPETTYETIRPRAEGSLSSSSPHMTKAAAPAATSALVRVPAMRCCHCRSNPTVAPIAIASTKRMAK